jgi:hypothetical protein
MQCKDIPDLPILEFLAKSLGVWHNWSEGHERDVGHFMPAETPRKLVLAKMRGLMRRGLVDGCGCGCRGDFEITPVGLDHMRQFRHHPKDDRQTHQED